MKQLEPQNTSPKVPKALVLRLSSMGDVVLATAAIEPLRRAGYSICFVTKAAFAPLLREAVDEIYAFDKTGGEKAARERLFQWYDQQSFDFVLDLQDSWRTRFWRWRLRKRAPVFVARKERLREWLILYARMGSWLGFGCGGRAAKFRRLTELALCRRGARITSDPTALTQLTVTAAERRAARAILPAGDFIALAPGSAWKGKEWPYFPELASKLKLPVVALGAEKDLACEAAVGQSAHPESRSLRGQTSLRESMAVLAEARWVIGNDTGLVHVAEALGRDVAMVEGPTHEVMGFSPYRPGSILLGLPLVCRPCSKTGRFCPRLGSRLCLTGLSVAAVREKLRRGGWPC